MCVWATLSTALGPSVEASRLCIQSTRVCLFVSSSFSRSFAFRFVSFYLYEESRRDIFSYLKQSFFLYLADDRPGERILCMILYERDARETVLDAGFPSIIKPKPIDRFNRVFFETLRIGFRLYLLVLLLAVLAICRREEKKSFSVRCLFGCEPLKETRQAEENESSARQTSPVLVFSPLRSIQLHCSFNFILVFVICILPLKANLLI